ncbi:hypothetical protein [Solidesulfovibrio alcoholivorans]|uniref:hypothetical protein n=1 Tax=Solidesulfovibrio alcoholivorans TaxID=81406 RepID=UPI000495F014|nr:hypothetical protein [Solidesulfovibrio alcoholivorans]
MKKIFISITLACALIAFSVNAGMANVAANGATIVKTGVVGTYTYVVFTLSGSSTEIWMTIPSGDSFNPMLATALSAQSSGRSVRLVASSTFANWQPLLGIMMEN